jgi:hypothetical protein
MIKAKYPKGSDVSQIARLVVERATGAALVPVSSIQNHQDRNYKTSKTSKRNNRTKKQEE